MKMSELNQKYNFEGGENKGFMSMKEPGSYLVRIVSEAFPYQKAPYKQGDKPRTVFLFHVIDRADGELKLWEMGWSIMKQYKALSQDPDYTFEDMPNYDIKVIKTKTGPETQNVAYQVLPGKEKTLTDEENEKILGLKPIDEIGLKLAQKEAEKMSSAVVSNEDSQEIDPDEIPF